MKIVQTAIADLIKYDKNARVHSSEQIDQIAKSIKNFGFNDPIEIDKNNILLSGHARLEAAQRLGLKTVPTITHGHMSKTQQKGYVLAANRIALSSTWDNTILGEELQGLKDDGMDLSITGFTPDELDDLLNHEMLNEGLVDADECGDVDEVNVVSQLGDVWLLGEHKLMCGDSTSIDAVDKLMNGLKADMVFTDPPYNTGMTPESQKGSGGLWKGKGNSSRLSNMFDDSYTDDEWNKFMSLFTSKYVHMH